MRVVNIERFEVTEDHIKLIQRMNIDYNDCCEFGAPCVNPKRPYGNSNVFADINEILGLGFEEDENGCYNDNQLDIMYDFHSGTTIVLQILIQNISDFGTGAYEREKFGGHWKRVG